jgi:hypothetical protein
MRILSKRGIVDYHQLMVAGIEDKICLRMPLVARNENF